MYTHFDYIKFLIGFLDEHDRWPEDDELSQEQKDFNELSVQEQKQELIDEHNVGVGGCKGCGESKKKFIELMIK